MGYQDVRNDISKECARNLILRIVNMKNSQIITQYIKIIRYSAKTVNNLQVGVLSFAETYM